MTVLWSQSLCVYSTFQVRTFCRDKSLINPQNRCMPLCFITIVYKCSLQKITVIAEIFVRVKNSYSSVCQLQSYARHFRTVTVVSDTHAYVYGFRMLLNFVLYAKSTKYTKLNRVRKFVRLQYFVVCVCRY